jgi:hypothetical protein
MDDPTKKIQVPVAWVGVEDLPMQFANAFTGLVQPNEIFVQLGSYAPPAITGTNAEEREASARAVAFIPVKPIARLAFTPARLDEFITMLEDTRRNYVALMEGLETRGET